MKTRTILGLIAVLAAALILQSCTDKQIVQSLERATDAAILATPIAEQAAGVSAETQAIVGQYLLVARDCLGVVAGVIADPNADAASQALTAGVGCARAMGGPPPLPAGTDPKVVAVVRGVFDALQALVAAIPPAPLVSAAGIHVAPAKLVPVQAKLYRLSKVAAK